MIKISELNIKIYITLFLVFSLSQLLGCSNLAKLLNEQPPAPQPTRKPLMLGCFVRPYSERVILDLIPIGFDFSWATINSYSSEWDISIMRKSNPKILFNQWCYTSLDDFMHVASANTNLSTANRITQLSINDLMELVSTPYQLSPKTIVVKTTEGHYAKFTFIGYHVNQQAYTAFLWAYNPNGDPIFQEDKIELIKEGEMEFDGESMGITENINIASISFDQILKLFGIQADETSNY